jgi:hypothetical protein
MLSDLRISEERWDTLCDIIMLGEWVVEEMQKRDNFSAETISNAREMLVNGRSTGCDKREG